MNVFGYNADAGSTNAGLELAELIAQGMCNAEAALCSDCLYIS